MTIDATIPTSADLIRRIDEIRPILEGNVHKTESDRRVAQENVDALTSAGVFRVSLPRRFGGFGMSLRDELEVSAAVAESCGSTAWVVTLLNTGSWMAAHLPEAGQDDVLGSDENPLVAGVLSPGSSVKKVDGGYIISGKWPWASGSWHANWAFVGTPIVDEHGNVIDQASAFVPMEELTIEETWFVAGMKGTGSNTLVGEDVFVPEHRLMLTSAVLRDEPQGLYPDEPVYRASFVPYATAILAGAQLGLGRAALKVVLEKASRRGITYTRFQRQTESTGFQIQVSRAAMLIDTAHLHAFRTADDIDRAAEQDRPVPYLERARMRADIAYSVSRITDAINLLMSAHGAGGFADSSSLQRIWRDSNTAGRHAGVDAVVNEEIYGKALVGIPFEENISPLI